MSVIPSTLDNDACDIAIRASFLHFHSDPDDSGDAYEYLEDGLLILKQGRVRYLVEACDWIDHLPDGSGLELLREFADRLPGRTVLLSGVTDAEEALFVLEHSEARAFISKEIDLDDLADALGEVMDFNDDDSTWIWRSGQRAFVPSGEAFPRESTLTPKEREVFMLMREGLLDKQIAERLHRSVHTIRVQIRAIRRKRGSSRRAEIEG